MRFFQHQKYALVLLSLLLPFAVSANSNAAQNLTLALEKAEEEAKRDALLISKHAQAHHLLNANDEDGAKKIFTELATQGFAPSMHILGLILTQDGDPSGFKWIQKASELNYAPAQCDEAAEYMQMLKKQKKQSDKDRYSQRIRSLVKKSSDGRFARCQLVYSMDSSLTKEESIGLLISSARQRNADAQALLAEVYESGYGLYKKNLVESYAWYSNAIINGSSFDNLSFKLERLKSEMSQDDMDKAIKLSRDYYSTLKRNDHVFMWVSPPLF